jgi:hypothetical protein
MTPSWDLFIILFFVIMGVYGFLLGRGRVFNILINTYVGLVIATQLGSYAFDYLSKITEISHSFNVTLFGAKVFAFVAVLFVLTLNKELSGTNDDSFSSPIYTATYGVLAAGLILTSVFSFMGDAERASLFASSNLASTVYQYQILWLVAPIVVVIVSNVLTRIKK